MKKCCKCLNFKEANHINYRWRKGRNTWESMCRQCRKERDKLYRKENKAYIKQKSKEYKYKNKEMIRSKNKIYRENNKEKIKNAIKKWTENNKEHTRAKSKIWRENNKEKIAQSHRKRYENNKDKFRKYQREWRKFRRANDPLYKLRHNISTRIGKIISKNESSWKNLPYTKEELKTYLESQFEPWMNWDNYGRYYKNKWNDNDPSTWTWQIDHIIPQSDLPYDSMEHENFKKCWALDNLRPYSAKKNILECKRTYAM